MMPWVPLHRTQLNFLDSDLDKHLRKRMADMAVLEAVAMVVMMVMAPTPTEEMVGIVAKAKSEDGISLSASCLPSFPEMSSVALE